MLYEKQLQGSFKRLRQKESEMSKRTKSCYMTQPGRLQEKHEGELENGAKWEKRTVREGVGLEMVQLLVME